jgi:hypothetical protein
MIVLDGWVCDIVCILHELVPPSQDERFTDWWSRLKRDHYAFLTPQEWDEAERDMSRM